MTRFNRAANKPSKDQGRSSAARSPISTGAESSGLTHAGGPGWARSARGELFLLAIANMVGTASFYEGADRRDERFEALIRELAAQEAGQDRPSTPDARADTSTNTDAVRDQDANWLARFIPWLRASANMRSASLVAAAVTVKTRLELGVHGGNRAIVDAACQRADEPGELLALWHERYGRAVPQPVKRGLADAVARLYNGRSLLKYDTASHGFRFGDVIELVHPTPRAGAEAWQGELFRYALDRRHHPDDAVPPDSVPVLTAHASLLRVAPEERRALIGAPNAAERLREAGFTWELLASWLGGPMDARAWQAAIPSMGYFALLRNLRNFEQAGISRTATAKVRARLTDPAEVAASRLFPFRFLAAHRNTRSPRWGPILETALGHSLANVPALGGRTLILVDRSGSMFGAVGGQTQLNRADAAAVFGTALALRAHRADLVEFGTGSNVIRFEPGDAVLRVLKKFGSLGGTDTAGAVRRHYRGHDRVVIVTDEQAAPGHAGGPTALVPEYVPVYTWNLAGYRLGHGPSGGGGGNRHVFGGLTDQAFAAIPLLEAGASAGWPF